MFDDWFRKRKDEVFEPLARYLGRIHPNWITLASLLVALLSAGLVARQFYITATLAWAISRVLDGLDGAVARINNQQSDLGGYLDILGDFVAYAALPIAVVWGHPSEWYYQTLVLLLTSYYINAASWMYLSSLLEKRAQGANARGEVTSVAMPGGLVGGTETVLMYGFFTLFAPQAGYLFVLFSLMVLFTVGQRLYWAVKHLS